MADEDNNNSNNKIIFGKRYRLELGVRGKLDTYPPVSEGEPSIEPITSTTFFTSLGAGGLMNKKRRQSGGGESEFPEDHEDEVVARSLRNNMKGSTSSDDTLTQANSYMTLSFPFKPFDVISPKSGKLTLLPNNEVEVNLLSHKNNEAHFRGTYDHVQNEYLLEFSKGKDSFSLKRIDFVAPRLSHVNEVDASKVLTSSLASFSASHINSKTKKSSVGKKSKKTNETNTNNNSTSGANFPIESVQIISTGVTEM